jgi:hypothetical protein
LAPPPLDEARSSLEYWRRRRQTLPLHRRGLRREADEMAARWHGRVLAAEQARFDASWPGRLLRAVGLASYWPGRPAVNRRAVLFLAWRFVPRRFKLAAGGAAAVAVLVLAGSVAALALLLGQL